MEGANLVQSCLYHLLQVAPGVSHTVSRHCPQFKVTNEPVTFFSSTERRGFLILSSGRLIHMVKKQHKLCNQVYVSPPSCAVTAVYNTAKSQQIRPCS